MKDCRGYVTGARNKFVIVLKFFARQNLLRPKPGYGLRCHQAARMADRIGREQPVAQS
jgi:hypothetical protein